MAIKNAPRETYRVTLPKGVSPSFQTTFQHLEMSLIPYTRNYRHSIDLLSLKVIVFNHQKTAGRSGLGY
jgi:GDP-D-mannose dehydratase